MMRKFFAALLLWAAAAGWAGTAVAADRYVFDKAHTHILFFVSHLGFTTTQGSFGDFDGNLVFDENAVENSSVSVTIRTASLDTNFDKLDIHLRSADFFDVAKYPEMVFTSTKVEKTGANTGRMTGDLTMHGVTKPVSLDLTLNKSAISPVSNKQTLGFSARGSLKRSDFGLNYLVPLVGDEVDIWIEAEAGLEE